MTGAATPDVFPCPVFEGSEKRISVSFSAGTSTPRGGLRCLTRTQLDAMLDLVRRRARLGLWDGLGRG